MIAGPRNTPHFWTGKAMDFEVSDRKSETMNSKKNVTRVQINGPIEKGWEALTEWDEPLPFFFGQSCTRPD
ncbi:MAG: hypothetical protein M2R45_01479 [Verrucomicrobia subdivision 3 bacterium]|nr:hypothetical protein [Limisphaerales bacterium]MCS1413391.1 hypothetical protein [Limisphaerales bacterium]